MYQGWGVGSRESGVGGFWQESESESDLLVVGVGVGVGIHSGQESGVVFSVLINVFSICVFVCFH